MKEHAWSVVVYCHAYKLARYLFKTREEARVFKCKSMFSKPENRQDYKLEIHKYERTA